MKLFNRWLAWRLRREEFGLPDLPEVRKLMRWAWLHGFSFGGFERQVAAAKQEAFDAIRRESGSL